MSSRKRTSSETRGGNAAAPFVYRPAPNWRPPREDAASGGIAVLTNATASAAEVQTPSPEDLALARERQAFENGFCDGEASARAESEAKAQKQREAVAEALRAFARQRDEYFRRVEAEVVSLALAVARKVLRREAQIDPLLLTGMVRVALEKMGANHNVRLRVHPSQIAAWQEFIAQQTDFPRLPELSGDAALEPNQCQIETELGVTELNLEAQLKEIEQGLFDLLSQRPLQQ